MSINMLNRLEYKIPKELDRPKGPGATQPGSQIIGGPDAVLKKPQGWFFGNWWQGSQSLNIEELMKNPKFKEEFEKNRKWGLAQNGLSEDRRKYYADMYSNHDGKKYATQAQTPNYKSTRSGTANLVTRKSMGLGAIFNSLKFVVPYAWEAGKYVGDLLVNTLFQGAQGYEKGVSDTWISSRDMDGTPTAEEMKSEEILVATQSEMTRRQIVAAMAEQSHIEASVLNMPIVGLKHSEVTVSLHLEYTFSPAPTEVNTQIGIPNVNFNDHVVMHLMPKNFAFYKNLLKHELIKFNRCTIVSSNTSGFDTTTNIGFFPATKETYKVSNAVLLQMAKRLELNPEEKMSYTIRYVSPAVVEYELDEQKNYKNIRSHQIFLEPNKIIRTDNLKSLAADEALSYGTVVIVKQNVGTVIGMSYTVNMVFDCWDYIINGCKLEEVEDKNLDGDTTDPGEPDHPDDGDDGDGGDGSGSVRPPAGSARVGRRQMKKN